MKFAPKSLTIGLQILTVKVLRKKIVLNFKLFLRIKN